MASVTASTTPKTLQERSDGPDSVSGGGGVGDSARGKAGALDKSTAPALQGDLEPWFPTVQGSVARRMALIAAGWIFILLLVGAIALERTLATQAQNNLDEQHSYTLNAMIISAEVNPLGEVWFNRALGDQRFLEPNSGHYWQISGTGLEPYPSRSLWDDRTLDVRGADDPNALSEGPIFYTTEQFEDETLRVAERSVILPGSDTIWTFAVATETDDLEAQITRIRSILAWSFAILGLGLFLMVLLQIRYGLSPLRRVRAAIANLRSTGANRITEPLPSEVQPLVQELNGLLEHSERQAEEARRHAGNLAHALKTPLTVLTNAATAQDPELNRAVFRETKVMQRHVDHHLARARAVGRRAIGHARTAVRDSAEAVQRAVERLYTQVRFDIAGGRGALVSIERQDLDEILGNLIENAAKYGGGSVFVTLDVDENAEQCEIWVEDDGAGIPPEKRDEIFDRGARLDTGKPGTGLGLAIVRDVAEIYGGSVELEESEDLGGLLVKLCLPRAA